MTDQPDDPYAAPAPVEAPTIDEYAARMVRVDENVGQGLLLALGGVLVGIAVIVAIAAAGYVAGLSGVVLAAAAAFLYRAGAGYPPRRGLVPLVVLIAGGLVAGHFASVAYVLHQEGPDHGVFIGWGESIRMAFDSEVVSATAGDLAKLVLYGGFGAFAVIRGIVKRDRQEQASD